MRPRPNLLVSYRNMVTTTAIKRDRQRQGMHTLLILNRHVNITPIQPGRRLPRINLTTHQHARDTKVPQPRRSNHSRNAGSHLAQIRRRLRSVTARALGIRHYNKHGVPFRASHNTMLIRLPRQVLQRGYRILHAVINPRQCRRLITKVKRAQNHERLRFRISHNPNQSLSQLIPQHLNSRSVKTRLYPLSNRQFKHSIISLSLSLIRQRIATNLMSQRNRLETQAHTNKSNRRGHHYYDLTRRSTGLPTVKRASCHSNVARKPGHALSLPFSRTITTAQTTLTSRNFNMLARVSVRTAVQTGLNRRCQPVLVLKTYGPKFTRRTVNITPDITALLPYGIIIQRARTNIRIRAISPTVLIRIASSSSLAPLTRRLHTGLRQIFTTLPTT